MEKEDTAFLNQLILSLEESEKYLEKAHGRGDSVNFNRAKKLILQIQMRMGEMLK